MTAREMFEELGYSTKDGKNYERIIDGGDHHYKIITINESGIWCYELFKNVGMYVHDETKTCKINPLEFKAIQKQIEELGWEE